MDQYKCLICDKLFTQKQSLDKHIINKVCTGKKYDSEENDIKKYKCKKCNKGFSIQSSRYRHENNSCKIVNNVKNDDLIAKILILEKENTRLNTEHEKLKNEFLLFKNEFLLLKNNISKIKTTNNIYNGNITNGNVINNINLVCYGKEDISKIDKTEFLEAVKCGYNSTLKLTETLHFNPKYPEYHNIYITNIKDKYAMMFCDSEWKLITKNDLIDKIYDDKKTIIEENIDDIIESISIYRKNALLRWLNTDDNDSKISKIKNEIKLLMYNKRSMIIKK